MKTLKPSYSETEYDFYYSEKHYGVIQTYNRLRLSSEEKKKDTFINGKKYTEMIRKGEIPATNYFGDLELVYSGKSKNITFGT